MELIEKCKQYGILERMRGPILDTCRDRLERGFLIKSEKGLLVATSTIVGKEGEIDLPLVSAEASFHTHADNGVGYLDCSPEDAKDMMRAGWRYMIIGSARRKTPTIVVYVPSGSYEGVRARVLDDQCTNDEGEMFVHLLAGRYQDIFERLGPFPI